MARIPAGICQILKFCRRPAFPRVLCMPQPMQPATAHIEPEQGIAACGGRLELIESTILRLLWQEKTNCKEKLKDCIH
jgi:hypothetical protein